MRERRWKREGVGVGRVTGGRPGERKRGRSDGWLDAGTGQEEGSGRR